MIMKKIQTPLGIISYKNGSKGVSKVALGKKKVGTKQNAWGKFVELPCDLSAGTPLQQTV